MYKTASWYLQGLNTSQKNSVKQSARNVAYNSNEYGLKTDMNEMSKTVTNGFSQSEQFKLINRMS